MIYRGYLCSARQCIYYALQSPELSCAGTLTLLVWTTWLSGPTGDNVIQYAEQTLCIVDGCFHEVVMYGKFAGIELLDDVFPGLSG